MSGNFIAISFRNRKYDYIVIFILSFLAAITINLRGLIPYDETRYLAVAWEMWRNNNFFIPHVNGEIYADKPPLLFWLINLGWYIIGPNEWFPRSIPFIFSALDIFLARYIALQLWPESRQMTYTIPLVFLAMPVWFLYSTPLMFDMLQVFFVLIAIIGLINFDQAVRGPLIFGIATGLGFLLKGPVIYIYVLPLAALLPIWNKKYQSGYGKLAIQIIAALFFSLIIISAWIVPVIHNIGLHKTVSLFLHQTADRVTHATSHSRPAWWYLYFLPILVFPWLYKSDFLKSTKISKLRTSPQIWFCFIWIFIPFVFFSIIDAKQLHYLLPLLPPVAILTAYGLENLPNTDSNRNNAIIGIIYILTAIIFIFYIEFTATSVHKSWISNMPAWWTFIAIGTGLILVFNKSKSPESSVLLPAAMTVTVLFSIYICVLTAPRPFTNIEHISKFLASLQNQNIPLGNIGTHREQFEFPGRLNKTLDKIESNNVRKWAEQHPDGYLVAKIKESEFNKNNIKTAYSQPYRFKHILVVISSKEVLKNNYPL